MDIKILGSGCENCKKLEENVREAVKRLRINANIQVISEKPKIMSYGVLEPPAMVIEGDLRICGRVPKVDEIMEMIKRVMLAS